MTNLERENRFVLLDGMRGIAALGIMSFHLWLPDERYFKGFATFVDFFFVLSGFVLAPKLLTMSKQTRKDFFQSRVLRLFPMLVPVFLVMILTQKISIISQHMMTKPQASLIQYVFAFLLLQMFWAPLIDLNVPLWSLSAEWLINLFAICIKPQRFFLIIIAIGLLAETVGIYLDHKYQLNWGTTKYLVALGRVTVGFYLGIQLRQSMIKKNKLSSKKKLSISLFLFCINFYLYGFSSYFVLLAAPLCWFLIGEVARIDESRITRFTQYSCSYLGRISYGVYAWHVVIGWINFPAFIIKYGGINLNAIERNVFDVIVTMLVVIFMVEVSIRFFETPIKRVLTKM